MPSQGQAVARQAQTALKLVMKHGPRLAATLAVVVTFIRDNPAVPAWLRKQLDEMNRRTRLLPRSDAARIRGMLDIIRDVLQQLDAHDSDSGTDASTWTGHADSIGHRVRLAEALPKPEQKRNLAQLVAETEALLSDLINALARTTTPPTTTTPHTQET